MVAVGGDKLVGRVSLVVIQKEANGVTLVVALYRLVGQNEIGQTDSHPETKN